MKITILAIGIRQPTWATEAIEDFLKRFPRDFTVEIKSIKPEARTGLSPQVIMQKEAQRLWQAIPENSYVIAMDEHGEDWTTKDLATFVEKNAMQGIALTFIIGGPDGLDPELKKKTKKLLRLSSMTLPHALARVILTEQIYRVWSLINHHPYHRE